MHVTYKGDVERFHDLERITHTLSGVFVQGADEVDVNPLLFAQDAQRPQLPPSAGRKIGPPLTFGSPPSEPLDEVEVVRLEQPLRDLDEARVTGQPRLRISVMHESKKTLLGLVAEEKLHATFARPCRPIFVDRDLEMPSA